MQKATDNKLSFNEARRLKGPIYHVLMTELNEEGCPMLACHFQKLVDKERLLFQRGVIRDKMSDNRQLLLKLFENFKMAEKASRVGACGGLAVSFRLLLQGLDIFEPFKDKLDWMLADIYIIISKLCERVIEKAPSDVGTREMTSRIYFKYGQFLSKKDDMNALRFLQKSLALTREEMWLTHEVRKGAECGEFEILHQEVARTLSSVLLKYGKQLVGIDSSEAEELAQKAILVLAEAGVVGNKLLYCQAYLTKAKFLIESEKYVDALKILNGIQHDITAKQDDVESAKLRCELFLTYGVCYSSLNETGNALVKLSEAVLLSGRYKLKDVEAEALLNIGKLWSKKRLENFKAKAAFEEAKDLFTKLEDMKNKQKTIYLLAKLKADDIFPFFLELLKSAPEQYCGFYNLRQWKHLGKPFWKTMGEELTKQNEDSIYCILQPDNQN